MLDMTENDMPNSDRIDLTSTSTEAPTSRRKLALAASVGAGAVALGAVAVGSFASAGSADSPSLEVTASNAAQVDESIDTGDAGMPPLPDELIAFEECISNELGFDPMELAPDFEKDWFGGVFVEGADGGVAYNSFGEGDGTITITKVDGEISVTTDGDVVSEDLSFDVVDENFAQWQAAFEACEAQFPDLEEIFPVCDVIGSIPLDLDLGELDLGELDLGELDLGELPTADEFGELGELFDAEKIDELVGELFDGETIDELVGGLFDGETIDEMLDGVLGADDGMFAEIAGDFGFGFGDCETTDTADAGVDADAGDDSTEE